MNQATGRMPIELAALTIAALAAFDPNLSVRDMRDGIARLRNALEQLEQVID